MTFLGRGHAGTPGSDGVSPYPELRLPGRSPIRVSQQFLTEVIKPLRVCQDLLTDPFCSCWGGRYAAVKRFLDCCGWFHSVRAEPHPTRALVLSQSSFVVVVVLGFGL
jgi:hypothetical protein